MKQLMLILLLTLFPGSIYAVNDIAGVEIGTPIEGKKPFIIQANPSYEIQETNKSSKSKCIQAISKKDRVIKDMFVICSNNDGLIWFVGRNQVLDEGSRIKPDIFLSSLKEKYGKTYTTYQDDDRFYIWQTDRNGKAYDGNAKYGPCHGVKKIISVR